MFMCLLRRTRAESAFDELETLLAVAHDIDAGTERLEVNQTADVVGRTSLPDEFAVGRVEGHGSRVER